MKQMRLTTTFSVRDFFFSSHFIFLWATASWFLWSKLRRHLSALYPICTQLWLLCGPGLFHSHVPVLSPGRKGSGSSLGSQQGVSRSRIQQLSRFSERWKENAGLANGLDVFLFKKSSSRIEKIDFLGCFLFFFFFFNTTILPWMCGSHDGVSTWESVPGILSRCNLYLPDPKGHFPPTGGCRI